MFGSLAFTAGSRKVLHLGSMSTQVRLADFKLSASSASLDMPPGTAVSDNLPCMNVFRCAGFKEPTHYDAASMRCS